jgi:hypothetical protein
VAAAHQVGVVPPDRPRSLSDDSAAAANAAWFKRRHYAIARGSAMECAAAVDVIRIRGLAEASAVAALRALFVRAIQMLTKLDDALA